MIMPGTPETVVQNTSSTSSRGKLIVTWQQLGFSHEHNCVGAEHVNSLQSLKNLSRSFYPMQDLGKFNSSKQSPSQSPGFGAVKEQVEVPEAEEDSQVSNISKKTLSYLLKRCILETD